METQALPSSTPTCIRCICSRRTTRVPDVNPADADDEPADADDEPVYHNDVWHSHAIADALSYDAVKNACDGSTPACWKPAVPECRTYAATATVATSELAVCVACSTASDAAAFGVGPAASYSATYATCTSAGNAAACARILARATRCR